MHDRNRRTRAANAQTAGEDLRSGAWNAFAGLLLLVILCVSACRKSALEEGAIHKEDKAVQKIVYLRKSGDELVSFCKCGDGLVTFPAQLDCPWCGCGWLFTCIQCRKPFTFAEGVEIESSWEALARRDITNRNYGPVTDARIAEWITAMKEILADVRPGEHYVILDGKVFPRTKAALAFDGWYARHDLKGVPHVQALTDPGVKTQILANEGYWKKRAISVPASR